MEGVLWKWTNYWNGWQTRWFVLENGMLSYYKSQEEVSQGCKGSVKVSVCQINVNPIDSTRMDLVIPGQQHMYLRAPSPQDRQKWLVALGSAKACVDSKGDIASGLEDRNTLVHKKSELRLYCDLMMQQVHAVKSAAAAEGTPNIQEIDDASSLLTATCDTFIRTLEDIMKLTSSGTGGNGVPYEMPLPNIVKNNNSTKVTKPSLNRSLSQDNSTGSDAVMSTLRYRFASSWCCSPGSECSSSGSSPTSAREGGQHLRILYARLLNAS